MSGSTWGTPMAPGAIAVIVLFAVTVISYVILRSAEYMKIPNVTFGICFLIISILTVFNKITKYFLGDWGGILAVILGILLLKFILKISWRQSIVLYIIQIAVFLLLLAVYLFIVFKSSPLEIY